MLNTAFRGSLRSKRAYRRYRHKGSFRQKLRHYF